MKASPPAEKLSEIAARYWRFECEETPFLAVLAGAAADGEIVFRESAQDHERRATRARHLLEEVKALSVNGLTVQECATRSLLQRELEAIIALDDLEGHYRPSIFPAGPDFNTIFFANNTSISTLRDAERYLARLQTLPRYIRDIGENLLEGVERGYLLPAAVAARAAENTRGHIPKSAKESPWYAPFSGASIRISDAFQALARNAEGVIADDMTPALEQFAATLESIQTRDTISCIDAPRGREFYTHLSRYFTTTTLTPDEIHDLGVAEVARIADEMSIVAKKLGCSSVSALRKKVTEDPSSFAKSKADLRTEIESLCKRIDRLIPSYFKHIPRITYGVELIPEKASENMPPAYAQPSPADASNAGIFWLTSLVEKAPRHIHAALTLHEAWPGHLMHIALLQELEDLPDFRRYGAVKYTACIEGWALYCESLGREMGFYDDPYSDYGRLDMEMFRAVRLVVDTGIHWRGWSRQEAINYMREYLTLPLAFIESEVDRYVALPGQALAYQIGNLKIRELRNRAEVELGDDFSIRGFHEAVMTAGAVTLPILDDLVAAWFVEEKERCAGSNEAARKTYAAE